MLLRSISQTFKILSYKAFEQIIKWGYQKSKLLLILFAPWYFNCCFILLRHLCISLTLWLLHSTNDSWCPSRRAFSLRIRKRTPSILTRMKTNITWPFMYTGHAPHTGKNRKQIVYIAVDCLDVWIITCLLCMYTFLALYKPHFQKRRISFPPDSNKNKIL